MRATHLAATGLAAGAMALGMAGPALATPSPVPTQATPGAYCAEEHLGKKSKSPKGEILLCEQKAGEKQPRWRSTPIPGGEDPSTPPTKDPKPKFKFGTDKVRLSTRDVKPGGTTTFTVTCPNQVTITGNGYTDSPLTVKKAGKNTWTATGTFRSELPDPTVATVVCKGYGSVKLSTSPTKDDDGDGGTMSPKAPKIPTGRIDTGDGSTYRQSEGSALPAAGVGALLAAGLGGLALRRRTVRERS